MDTIFKTLYHFSIESGKKATSSGIAYSCYHSQSRDGEHFIPQHTLSFQISGSLILNDGTNSYPSSQGSFRLIKKNQLLRFIKQPPENGEFRSISIYIDQEILREFSNEYMLKPEGHSRESAPVIELSFGKLIKNYVNSLLDYQENGRLDNKDLIRLKIKEGIMLLLQESPELKTILFDFSEPHKIDLEAFMNQNYHFNVKLDRFAYLTGRSLATFKRDFARIFGDSPRHWLQHKRLHQAHYLMLRTGRTASDVYLDLGFEDLTHFSHAFKKEFGFSPSKILQHNDIQSAQGN
jgi:AraC-like DNA-binding protein